MTEAKVLGLAVGPAGHDTPIYREARNSVNLVEGQGVEGDKKFGLSKGRQVNLLSERSYKWFERNFGRERTMPGGGVERSLPAGDTHIAYSGEGGPWSSQRMEAHRIGFEDLELLRMLKREDAEAHIKTIVRGFDDYTLSITEYRKAREALLRDLG